MSKIEESFYEGISRLNTDFREKIGLIDEKSGITFSYKSIFDIVSNWKQRIEQLQSQKTVEKSLLYDSLGLK